MCNVVKPLLGKIVFTGLIHSITGLHIGGSKEVLEIGALDLPVIREPVTKEPYIPGSSLKGKFRSLLERKMSIVKNPDDPSEFFKRNVARKTAPVMIHVCNTKEDASTCEVCRIFGSSSGVDAPTGSNFPARLRVRDAYFPLFTRNELLKADTGFLFTELKYENSIDRITAAANPRQIERIPPDADFIFEVVYDVEDFAQLKEDLENIVFCFSALEDDSLGGHGSRGSGKVRFYFSKVAAKKVSSYKEGATDSNSRIIIAGPEVNRQTNEKPEADFLSVDKLRENLLQITSFFAI